MTRAPLTMLARSLSRESANRVLGLSFALVFAAVTANPAFVAAQSTLTQNTIRLDSAASSSPARIEDFAFLTGRWVGPGLGGETEEVWSSPGAGTMAGTFRFIQADKVVWFHGLTYARSGDELTIYLALRGADEVLREEVFRTRRAGG